MFAAVLIANGIEKRLVRSVWFSGATKVASELLAIDGKDLLNFDRAVFDQTFQETLRGTGGFVFEDFDVDSAGSVINCGKQVSSVGYIRHARQVFDLDMDEAGLVIFEGFRRLGNLFCIGLQSVQIGNTMATQTTIEA